MKPKIALTAGLMGAILRLDYGGSYQSCVLFISFINPLCRCAAPGKFGLLQIFDSSAPPGVSVFILGPSIPPSKARAPSIRRSKSFFKGQIGFSVTCPKLLLTPWIWPSPQSPASTIPNGRSLTTIFYDGSTAAL